MNVLKRGVQRFFGREHVQSQASLKQDLKPEMSMPLTPELVGSMVKGVLSTRPDELDCDECFIQLDIFAETYLVGKNASDALPLVQEHLNRCKDCREEFEALLLALQYQ